MPLRSSAVCHQRVTAPRCYHLLYVAKEQESAEETQLERFPATTAVAGNPCFNPSFPKVALGKICFNTIPHMHKLETVWRSSRCWGRIQVNAFWWTGGVSLKPPAFQSPLLDQGRTSALSPTVQPHCCVGVPPGRGCSAWRWDSAPSSLCSTLRTTSKFHEPSFKTRGRNWARKGKVISTSKETRVFLTWSQHPHFLRRSSTAWWKPDTVAI